MTERPHLRIAFFAWRGLGDPLAGGSELVVHHLATELALRGHSVQLFHAGPASDHSYDCTSLGGRFSQYFVAPFRSRRFRPDVVVDVSNGIGFFSPLWQGAPVVTLVHHVHVDQWAMYFPKPIAAFGRWLERDVSRRVYRRSRYVAVSSSTRSSLEEIGVAPTAIDVVEMGSSFTPHMRAPSESPRFVIIGRLVPHKRIDRALAMWDRVRPRTGGTLVIIGDGPERSRLERAAGPGVHFLGAVDERRKREELAAAWILVHTARHEGWGVVVMEAAIAGVPTLGFDVPGVRDSVADGHTGILAENEDDFVAQWESVSQDGMRRAALGRSARDRAATFTWTRAGDEFEKIVVDVARS